MSFDRYDEHHPQPYSRRSYLCNPHARPSAQYENLLNEQKEVFETEKSRALRTQEEKLTEEFTKQYSDQLRHHLQQQAQDFSEALHTKVVAGNDALKAELEAKHSEEVTTAPF